MTSFRLRRFVDRLRSTPFHPQWLLGARPALTGHIRSIERGRILDIGCSDRWARGRIPATCEYIGLDYPATGEALYGARPDVFADAAFLPLPNNCIDTVLFFEVCEHLERPTEAVREIFRVLRPGGCLLMTMPFLYPVHDAPHDYQRFTMHGIERKLRMAGFRIDHLQPSLGSAETGGLIWCLAFGGMAVRAVQERSPSIVLLPFVLAMVPIVNLVAWLLGRLLPSWPAVTAGYQLVATKT